MMKEADQTAALQQELEKKVAELEEVIACEQRSKEALRVSEERYRVIVEQSDDIMLEWDFEQDLIQFSSKYNALFGRAPHGTMRATTNPDLRRYIHPEDMEEFEAWILNTYRKLGNSEGNFRVADAWGNYLWLSCRTTAICDKNGTPMKAVGVFANIQMPKRLLEDLKKKAQLDPLTKLLNKEECRNRIDKHIKKHPREKGTLFMVDVDNFKEINDNLGHQLGDTMLKEIAMKIQNTFLETGMVGRIGGDEFVVYFPGADEDVIYKKAQTLAQTLQLSYYGSVTKYEISGSIGIARYPEHGADFDELYHHSDIALYDAKKKGKNCFVFYNENIKSRLLDKRTPVEYSVNFLNTYFQNDFSFQIFQMLYETKDISASIHMILELLGHRFSVARVNIFEVMEDRTYLMNTYEWCAPNVPSEVKNLKRIPMDLLGPYFALYSDEGVCCFDDIMESVPIIREVCEPAGIKSLLHCAMYENGEQIGFVGLESCSEHHRWSGDEIAVLGYIARILSVFMYKMQ